MSTISDVSYDFLFRVFQSRQPTKNLSKTPHRLDEFPIEFRICELQGVENFIGINHDDDEPQQPLSFFHTKLPTMTRTVWLPIHEILLQERGFCLSSLLSDMDVSEEEHEPILQEIASVARLAGTSRFPIIVVLLQATLVVVEQSEVDETHEVIESHEDDQVLDMIMRESESKSIPATKSSIEALEKVRFQHGSESAGECMICMQEFQTGLELACMPCSHVYHEECIVQWLETSHFCPLCRYTMPHM
uniref:RING-type E3 ubiquitin transferase n=1 Tax=Fagus sylvatica TaxID=28930 RepID=A0A2N9FVG2_FAGSY